MIPNMNYIDNIYKSLKLQVPIQLQHDCDQLHKWVTKCAIYVVCIVSTTSMEALILPAEFLEKYNV